MDTKPATDYDLIIVGGGATGSALALMLATQRWRVLLVERSPLAAADSGAVADAPLDLRSIALAQGSVQILQTLGVWPALAPHAAAIEHIQVSDRGSFGHCQLHADELSVPALGQVVELNTLNRVLADAVQSRAAADTLAPASAVSYREAPGQILLQVEVAGARRELSAQLVLACDGSGSSLRRQAAIPVQTDDYGQTAIVANVAVNDPKPGWAFERFTADGPLALLPLPARAGPPQSRAGALYSLVWCLPPASAAQIGVLPEPEFLAQLQAAFGWRLGAFTKTGTRQMFPLQRIVSAQRSQGRLLLLGNAAQQLHPVAGQGFNLALRDAQVFAATLAATLAISRATNAIISPALIQAFLQDSQADREQVLSATDALVRGFSNDYPGLAPLRGLALETLGLLPAARERVARRAMGLARKS